MRFEPRLVEQAERAAHPGDEQFRLLVSRVADLAIYLIDPGGRVMSWNAGAERIKGYRAEEIVGREFAQFYTPEDRAAGRPQQALARAAAAVPRRGPRGYRTARTRAPRSPRRGSP